MDIDSQYKVSIRQMNIEHDLIWNNVIVHYFTPYVWLMADRIKRFPTRQLFQIKKRQNWT